MSPWLLPVRTIAHLIGCRKARIAGSGSQWSDRAQAGTQRSDGQEARGSVADFQAAIVRIFCNGKTRLQTALSEVCHGDFGARSRLREWCGKMIEWVQRE